MNQRKETEQKPLIGIAMATYNPCMTFFVEQISSLQKQDYQNWSCVLVDDNSSEESFKSICEVVKHDPRFQVHRNHSNLGSFRTFEKALSLIPESSEFICFCDQDDIWVSEKLSTQLRVFQDPSVAMVHTDQSLVDKDGNVFVTSCWELEGRSILQATTDLLLFRNLITGCTSMFRKSVLGTALPFYPMRPKCEMYHHDMWIAMHACVHGKVLGMKEPLVQYRQHGSNLVGVSILQRGSKSRGMVSRACLAFRERYGMRQDFLSSLKVRKKERYAEQSQRLAYLDRPFGLVAKGFLFVASYPRFLRIWIMLAVGYLAFHWQRNADFKFKKVL